MSIGHWIALGAVAWLTLAGLLTLGAARFAMHIAAKGQQLHQSCDCHKDGHQ